MPRHIEVTRPKRDENIELRFRYINIYLSGRSSEHTRKVSGECSLEKKPTTKKARLHSPEKKSRLQKKPVSTFQTSRPTFHLFKILTQCNTQLRLRCGMHCDLQNSGQNPRDKPPHPKEESEPSLRVEGARTARQQVHLLASVRSLCQDVDHAPFADPSTCRVSDLASSYGHHAHG